MMATINEIVRRFGPQSQKESGDKMLPSHFDAMNAIRACRTEAMGGHLKICSECSFEHLVFHSCKNRSCPLCYFKQTQEWLIKQQERLLLTHYFHIIFTLPSEFRDIVYRHQKALYPVLFKAASEALQALGEDKRYVGGKLGIIEVLHTWSGAMIFHPHLHCLVPGVGMDEEGVVHQSRENFLVPVEALSAKFRGRFLALARKAVPDEDFSKGCDVEKWVAFSNPIETNNVGKVINYLGRYLHRIALSNSNIIKIEEEGITFRYKKSQEKGKKAIWGTMTLPPMEFLRRFFQHVLPKGMAKVRYYGFMASASSQLFKRVSTMVSLFNLLLKRTVTVIDSILETFTEKPCPKCGANNWEIYVIPKLKTRSSP
ncbi:transposase [Deltaproteobacteria bacterium TL4]